MNDKLNGSRITHPARRLDTISSWAIGLAAMALALLAPLQVTAQECPGLAEDPVFIGRYDTPYQAVSSVVRGTIAYVADDWAGALEILDVSDPSNPTLLGSYTPPDGPRDVVVIGTRVFLACAGAGLVILSAIDPTNPTLLGSFDTVGNIYGLDVVGNNAYLPSSTAGILEVVNVSDSFSPTLVSSISMPGPAIDVTVEGWTAYVSNYLDGFTMVDVSNPGIPVLLGSYDTPDQCLHVAVSGTAANAYHRECILLVWKPVVSLSPGKLFC